MQPAQSKPPTQPTQSKRAFKVKQTVVTSTLKNERSFLNRQHNSSIEYTLQHISGVIFRNNYILSDRSINDTTSTKHVFTADITYQWRWHPPLSPVWSEPGSPVWETPLWGFPPCNPCASGSTRVAVCRTRGISLLRSCSAWCNRCYQTAPI